jgi:hypothetical protein
MGIISTATLPGRYALILSVVHDGVLTLVAPLNAPVD